jgi:hypothetical protein
VLVIRKGNEFVPGGRVFGKIAVVLVLGLGLRDELGVSSKWFDVLHGWRARQGRSRRFGYGCCGRPGVSLRKLAFGYCVFHDLLESPTSSRRHRASDGGGSRGAERGRWAVMAVDERRDPNARPRAAGDGAVAGLATADLRPETSTGWDEEAALASLASATW